MQIARGGMGFGGVGAEGVGKVLSEAGKDSRTEFKVSHLAVQTWGTACCASAVR